MSGGRLEPGSLVLHVLRCGGAQPVQRIADSVGQLVTLDVEDTLLALAAQGLVTRDPGPFGGWRLTVAGRAEDAQRVAAELAAAGARSEVAAGLDIFLPLNAEALEVFSAWQIRSQQPLVLNDHADAVYDTRVLGRLGALDARAQPLCRRLTATLRRFGHYEPRLTSALSRARAGERAAVSDGLDSYHAVWFQLHEDLLATLGRTRA